VKHGRMENEKFGREDLEKHENQKKKIKKEDIDGRKKENHLCTSI
jgi:hypothetical protein